MPTNKKPPQNSNTDMDDDSGVSKLSADIRKRMEKGAKEGVLEGDPTRSED
jgi:hypothetical protein